MTASDPPQLAAVAAVEAGEEDNPFPVVVRSLSFAYPFSARIIHDLSLTLPPGSRCLLTGANGAGAHRRAAAGGRWQRQRPAAAELHRLPCKAACLPVRAPTHRPPPALAGKTSLLQVLAGKYMVGEACVRILGRPAFHDIQLVGAGGCWQPAGCSLVPGIQLAAAGMQRCRHRQPAVGGVPARRAAAPAPGDRSSPRPPPPGPRPPPPPPRAPPPPAARPPPPPPPPPTSTPPPPLQVSSGQLSYLGPQWRRDIAFAGSNVAMQGDIAAGAMIFGVDGVDPARRDRCNGLAAGRRVLGGGRRAHPLSPRLAPHTPPGPGGPNRTTRLCAQPASSCTRCMPRAVDAPPTRVAAGSSGCWTLI